jgi:hypothetical protein
MSEGSPEDDSWLEDLIARSSLIPDPRLRHHWCRVVHWLPVATRYELAAILLDVEQSLGCD